jgi:hypothetical protein
MMIIAVDFDGTCVTHEYPKIGRFIGAEPVLKELVGAGHSLILWTMRSGKHLEDAVQWFNEREIPLFGINGNPQQGAWTKSPKAYAQLYIDDAALGTPLCSGLNGERPFVDWKKVREILLLHPQKIINTLEMRSGRLGSWRYGIYRKFFGDSPAVGTV